MLDYEEINDLNFRRIISRFGRLKKIRICYLSVYSPQYARTEYIENLIKRNKIRAIFIYEHGLAKYLKAIFKLIKLRKEYDIVLLSFRSHEILPLVKTFSKKPIIFDALISIYDTLCFDRNFFKSESLVGKGLKKLETFILKIPDFILVDTKTHMKYFCEEFNISPSKISFLYVGCSKKNFKPMRRADSKSNKFNVLWYGEALPVQGVDIILKAAKILEEKTGIVFTIIGPVRKKYSNLISRLGLKGVKFIDRVPYKELPSIISSADLCLGGHFSDLPKAKRVIAIKAFECIACGKPIILGDNAANRELFSKEKKIFLCRIANEQSLANAINTMKKTITN